MASPQELAEIIFENKEFQNHRHLNQLYTAFQNNLKLQDNSGDELHGDFSDYLSRIHEMKKLFTWIPIPEEYHTRFQKNSLTSTNLREIENNQQNLQNSLRAFNLAIAFASLGSLELALALEKRAEILIRLNEPWLAQFDIKNVAKITSYPKRFCGRLIELQKRCTAASLDKTRSGKKNGFKNPGRFYKIREKSKNVSGLADGVAIDYKPLCGRRVVCERDFDVGEVVLVDEPYALAFEQTVNWDTLHCTFCSKPILAGIPCDCCTFAFYCSTNCKMVSSKCHKYEQYLSYLKATKIMSVKVLLAARILFKVGCDELFRIYESGDKLYFDVEDEEGCPKRGFDKNGHYGNGYLPIYHLISHEYADLKAKSNCFKALLMTELMDSSGFFNCHHSPQFKDFIASLILRHMESIEFNAITLSELKENNNTNRYGAAIYPLLCLVNHSCDPNCVPVRSLKYLKTSVIALKPLKLGDEITFSYAPHFSNSDVSERRAFLRGKYNFTCICEACLSNWDPTNYTHAISESQCNACGRYILIGQCPKCIVKDIEIKRDLPFVQTQVEIIKMLIEQLKFEEALELLKTYLTFCYESFPGNFFLCLEFQELFKRALVGTVN